MQWMYILAGAVVCTVLAGCWPSGNAQEIGEHLKLPLRDSNEVCAPEYDLCSWATSTDAVVWARIGAIRLKEAPLVNDRTYDLVEHCDAPISPAIELDLIVDRVLHGQVADELTVRIGAIQRESWVPRPAFGALKSILDWSPNILVDSQLEVGSQIGVALHYDKKFKVWSLMGEPLFGLVRNGGDVDTVRFQDSPLCGASPTERLEGRTLEQVATTLSTCAVSSRGETRRENIRRIWGAAPQRFMAAVCLATPTTAETVPRAKALDEIQVLK